MIDTRSTATRYIAYSRSASGVTYCLDVDAQGALNYSTTCPDADTPDGNGGTVPGLDSSDDSSSTSGLTASYALTIYTQGSGEVTSDDGTIDCGNGHNACQHPYDTDTQVTLTATAAGDPFVGWAGACSGSELTCTVTIDELGSVTALFWSDDGGSGTDRVINHLCCDARPTIPIYDSYLVGVTMFNEGTVLSSPIPGSAAPTGEEIVCPAKCSTLYGTNRQETWVRLTATAALGFRFVRWQQAESVLSRNASNDGTCADSSESTCDLLIAGNGRLIVIAAVFERSGGGGSGGGGGGSGGGGGGGGSQPQNQTLPSVSGDTLAGSTLSADHGDWSESPTRYDYQWQVKSGSNIDNIGGATGSSYQISADFAGDQLRVEVTASNNDYSSDPADSAWTDTVTVPYAAGDVQIVNSSSYTISSYTNTSGYGYTIASWSETDPAWHCAPGHTCTYHWQEVPLLAAYPPGQILFHADGSYGGEFPSWVPSYSPPADQVVWPTATDGDGTVWVGWDAWGNASGLAQLPDNSALGGDGLGWTSVSFADVGN